MHQKYSINNINNKIPDSTHLALYAYGHVKCSDILRLVLLEELPSVISFRSEGAIHTACTVVRNYSGINENRQAIGVIVALKGLVAEALTAVNRPTDFNGKSRVQPQLHPTP